MAMTDEERGFWKTACLEIMRAQFSTDGFSLDDAKRDIKEVVTYADELLEEYKKRRDKED